MSKGEEKDKKEETSTKEGTSTTKEGTSTAGDQANEIADLKRRLELQGEELLQAQTALASEEFLEWLDKKDTLDKKGRKKETELSKDDIDGMSGSELANYIVETVVKHLDTKLGNVIDERIGASKTATMQRKFDAFAKVHPDWTKYRAEMQVLALQNPDKEDPEWLYKEAVKWRTPQVVTNTETEKPFLGAGEFVPEKGLSPREAAKRAIQKVLGREG